MKKVSLWVFLLGMGMLVSGGGMDGFDLVPKAANLDIMEKKIQAEGVSLFLRAAGPESAKDWLIALNGGPGQSSTYMRGLEKLAGESLRVVTYDQRGTGRSDKPVDGFALMKYVEDLEAVRLALGAEKIHVFGHSWGGIVVSRYATVHPNRIKSLIHMGGGPPSHQAMQEAQARFGQRVQQLGPELSLPAHPESLKELLEAILPAYFSNIRFPIPQEILDTELSQNTNQQTLQELGDYNFRKEMAAVRAPVLLLWGEDDPFGITMTEATKDALINTEVKVEILKNCGHYWHENPDDFFAALRKFLLSLPD